MVRLCGLAGELLRQFVCIRRVFVSLFAEFVSGEMISLVVGDGGGVVCVGGKIVKL